MNALSKMSAARLGARLAALTTFVLAFLASPLARAMQAGMGGAPVPHATGEDSLVVPTAEFAIATFMGVPGRTLLMLGFGVCALGLVFGIVVYSQLKNAPVHKAMLEISELIYETCKTYLITQIKFILLLELFIGVVIVAYYGVIKGESVGVVLIILIFSLIGIAGSCAVAWVGIRINTFANSRTAFASLRGKPFPVYEI